MKLKNLGILGILFYSLILLNHRESNASENQTENNYQQRKIVNILFNAPFLIIGPDSQAMFGGSADFSITQSWSLGPKFQIRSPQWGVGIDSKYNFAHQNFTSGWFINPSIDYIRDHSDHYSLFRLEVMARIGYGWFFKNGFNINVSAGPVAFTQTDAKVTENGTFYGSSKEPTTHGIGLVGHLSLGYSF